MSGAVDVAALHAKLQVLAAILDESTRDEDLAHGRLPTARQVLREALIIVERAVVERRRAADHGAEALAATREEAADHGACGGSPRR